MPPLHFNLATITTGCLVLKDSKLPGDCSPGPPPSPFPTITLHRLPLLVFGTQNRCRRALAPHPPPPLAKTEHVCLAWGRSFATLRLLAPSSKSGGGFGGQKKSLRGSSVCSALPSTTGRGASTLPPKLFRGRSGQKRRNISSPELEAGAETRNKQDYWRTGGRRWSRAWQSQPAAALLRVPGKLS